MGRYPELPPENVIAALKRLGFYVRRTRGGHTVMRRDSPFAQTVVPMHAKVKRHILAEIIGQAGVSREEFLTRL